MVGNQEKKSGRASAINGEKDGGDSHWRATVKVERSGQILKIFEGRATVISWMRGMGERNEQGSLKLGAQAIQKMKVLAKMRKVTDKAYLRGKIKDPGLNKLSLRCL